MPSSSTHGDRVLVRLFCLSAPPAFRAKHRRPSPGPRGRSQRSGVVGRKSLTGQRGNRREPRNDHQRKRRFHLSSRSSPATIASNLSSRIQEECAQRCHGRNQSGSDPEHDDAVGRAQEVVEVTSEAPLVETTSTQMGAVVNSRAVPSLPLNTRDTYQLLSAAARRPVNHRYGPFLRQRSRRVGFGERRPWTLQQL